MRLECLQGDTVVPWSSVLHRRKGGRDYPVIRTTEGKFLPIPRIMNKRKIHTEFWRGNLKKNDLFQYLLGYGRIILKWKIKKCLGVDWILPHSS